VILSYPFFTTASGGLECIIGLSFLLYSLLVFTNVDDSGVNEMVVDDSSEGLRKSFTIWTLSIAVAIGIAISAGFSSPELLKPSSSPGSWRFVAEKGFEITPAFSAMIIGLTLFTASVVAEIVRGSIQALPRGQVEASISLGLNPFQRLRLVILPQALRSMIPLLNNQFMNVWKNSSLAIIVAYNDIFYQFLVMANNVGKLIPLFLLLLVTYQFGSLMISAVMNWFNARVTSVKI
jgi:ABC-type amino acid transport system permease subunit